MESFFDQTLYTLIVKIVGETPAKILSILYVFSVLMKIIFGVIDAIVNTTSFEWDNRAWRRIKKSTAYKVITITFDVILRVKLPQARKK